MKTKSFFEVDHHEAHVSLEPHVDRKDGGHLVICPKRAVEHRWEMSDEEAREFMSFSCELGRAMCVALQRQDIPIERINFQDNGNWAIGMGKTPVLHLHLYGRARDSRFQTHGEALYFPKRETAFWEELTPLTDEDVQLIIEELKKAN